MVSKWCRQWCFWWTIQTIQMSPKVSSLSSLNMVSINHHCMGNANLNVIWVQLPVAQKSLVQETIEDAGHLCIFLPKFHCEPNFIEFFWGKAKKYIWDNCDGTFKTLKKNLPLALQSVQLSTIHLWEHHMHWWMNAYHAGLDTKAAQIQVKEFRYKSHWRVPKAVPQSLDFQIQ